MADGQVYNVRERPPSYFSLESERIASRAKKEVERMIDRISAEKATGWLAPSLPKVTLIILRHGFSEYNAENRFTGWADVELSNRGREEARFAGSLLREAGVVRLEAVYTSFLKRAIKTAWLMLDELELQWTPISYSWRLNERHYGSLQGQPKRQCSETHGVKQVQKWRRGIHDRPPPWESMLAASTVDRRYTGVDVPHTESLSDCTARLKPFLHDELFPAMRRAAERAEAEQRETEDAQRQGRSSAAPRGVPAFVITSSENLIRALVTELDGVVPQEVPLLDIPYATPLVYEFDSQLQPLPSPLAVHPLKHGYYLGDAERIAAQQRLIREAVSLGGSAGKEVADPSKGEESIEEVENCFLIEEDGDPPKERWVASDMIDCCRMMGRRGSPRDNESCAPPTSRQRSGSSSGGSSLYMQQPSQCPKQISLP
eukprot:CAMPEP_0174739596 /NCGR_PEP_ID=MMETSP1094-20130205/71879_1 /TAXON_ID=156173 /ORGANISM="Chrysochromulina brevifilum, Strain UTEX LB 985" /LENGTH=429 /DNA_ID=CAMNT_0015943179 /DNA_START=28 /DNA_END=1318 /DNA_ORIENTATION=+